MKVSNISHTKDVGLNSSTQMAWSLALASLMIVSYYFYSFGLSGSFIFDDIPNLSPIGGYKELSLWDNFWLFILEGNSGPTGRPISLASFYFNATSWPSNPSSFINTNIIIHLINGLLVYWLSFTLSAYLGLEKSKRYGFSFLLTALWVLNPMHTTTVLYIIQRMTELSATFMLTGILFYLYGRKQLFSHTKSGLLILFIGVGLSLVLSILSKENGVLLVAYIIVIEYFLLRPFNQAPPKYFNIWFVPTVVTPFIAIITYLAIHTRPSNFTYRNFSLGERLLTEPRILFDYLHHILLPNMGYSTLFHDDYVISKSLTAPGSTLVAIAGLIALIGLAAYLRKKLPIISFAILWFLAGHIIESTVIALELYFEHRNYLPAYGVLLPIAWYTSHFISSHKKTVIAGSVGLILLYTFITTQNSIIWGKPLALVTNLYKDHPNSERSRQAYIALTQAYGVAPVLIQKQNSLTNTKSIFYTTTVMLELTNACISNKATLKNLNETIPKLTKHSTTASTATYLKDFISHWKLGKCPKITTNDLEKYLLTLLHLDKNKKANSFSYQINMFLSDLYFSKKHLTKTMLHLNKAYNYRPTFHALKLRASYLASAGLYEDALKSLDDTSQLETTFRKKLAMKIKQKELTILRKNILLAMKKRK